MTSRISPLALSGVAFFLSLGEASGQMARPLPPTIPATVSNVRCGHGGSMPALFVNFDFTASAAVVDLRVATVYAHRAREPVVAGIQGPITLRQRGPGFPPPMPTPFSGNVAAGETVHLEVFGALQPSLYRSGNGDVELFVDVALMSGASVLHIRNLRCNMIPGG